MIEPRGESGGLEYSRTGRVRFEGRRCIPLTFHSTCLITLPVWKVLTHTGFATD